VPMLDRQNFLQVVEPLVARVVVAFESALPGGELRLER